MQVSIQLACFKDYIAKNGTVPQDIVQSIKDNAIFAWEQNSSKDEPVRFLHQMPSSGGLHFRFFNVNSNGGNDLTVSL